MDPETFERDPVLCGADPQDGIVAVEQAGPANICIFLRRGKALEQREMPFQGFILPTLTVLFVGME